MPARQPRLPGYCFFGVVVSGLVGEVELDEPELEPEPMLPVAEPDVPEPELLPEALPLMPGAPELELELLPEGEDEGEVLGDVLEPELDDDAPGREASLDLDEDGERSQPASASAAAAATSVSWVSLCMPVSFGGGGWSIARGKRNGISKRQDVKGLVPVMVR